METPHGAEPRVPRFSQTLEELKIVPPEHSDFPLFVREYIAALNTPDYLNRQVTTFARARVFEARILVFKHILLTLEPRLHEFKNDDSFNGLASAAAAFWSSAVSARAFDVLVAWLDRGLSADEISTAPCYELLDGLKEMPRYRRPHHRQSLQRRLRELRTKLPSLNL